MQVSAIPTKIDIIFASGASGTFVRPIPDTTSDPNAASWTLGYPPNTFVDPASGGQPPDGRDFNGLAQMLSAWVRWGNAGGPIFYDAAFSASVGGYPKWAMLDNATTVGQFWISTVDNNTSNPDTGGANWMTFPPAAGVSVTSFNGRVGAVVLTGGDVVSALGIAGLPLSAIATAPTGTILGQPTANGPGPPSWNPPSAYGIVSPTFSQYQVQQPSGVGSSEAFSANTWNSRGINTTVFNSVTGASLSAGQITLPAGTYRVNASGFADKLNSSGSLIHKLRLRDRTHSVTLVDGQNAGTLGYSGTTEIGVNATLEGIFTLATAAALTLDSWVTQAGTGGGGGGSSPPASSGEPEVYANVFFAKVA